MIVTLDTREPQEIRNYIKRKFKNIEFKEAALKEGDILIECQNDKNTKVLIERKRCSDLYGSVFGSKGHTARFPSQCARLITHQTNSVVVLLITDSVNDFVADMWKYKKMKVEPEVFDSIIASVMTRYNIRVLINPDKYKGIEQSIKVGIKVCEGNLDMVAHRNCDALMARLLNITLVQWHNIREVYGTDLTYIATADLSCIKGIGKVKEKRIKELLIGQSNEVDFLGYPDIMQMTLDELKSRGTLGYETYAPYYVCSYAMHAFNLMNQGRRVYWESNRLPNLRLHIIFVAPPGGMKTYYLSQMGMDEYAIFSNTKFGMNPKSNLNEAALIGTYIQQQGRYQEREGEAKTHARDFILMDEFTALMDAMKSNFNAQLDTQLLNALDHGHVSKSIAGGNIDYQTFFTLWGGIQPIKYDLSGGLGRRMCFIMNIPSKQLKRDLRKSIWESKNKRPNVDKAKEFTTTIDDWTSAFDQVDYMEYDYSVFELYEELDLEPYLLSGFDRLILGYHLAKGHIEPKMCLDVEDKTLYNMIIQQNQWRQDIEKGPDLIQVVDLIKEYGFRDEESDEHKWYIKVVTLNSVCGTLQMSISKIHEKIEEMKRCGMVQNGPKGLLVYEEA